MQRYPRLIAFLPSMLCALACAEQPEPLEAGTREADTPEVGTPAPAKADRAPAPEPSYPSANIQNTAIPAPPPPSKTVPMATDLKINRDPPRIIGDSKGGKGQQITAD